MPLWVSLHKTHSPQQTNIDGIYTVHFSIEMKTNVWKTSVYIKTILKLNKCYGFIHFAFRYKK